MRHAAVTQNRRVKLPISRAFHPNYLFDHNPILISDTSKLICFKDPSQLYTATMISNASSSTARSVRSPAAFSSLKEKGAPATITTQQTPKSSYGANGTWWLHAIPAFVVGTYGFAFFLFPHITPPGMYERMSASWFNIFHILGSAFALSISPLQFLHGLRKRHPVIHRWVGRAYVAGALVGCLAGLRTSLTSTAYPSGDWAFFCLAVMWMVTVGYGMKAIWRGDVVEHKEWMIRSYACAYAAPMLRWQ